MGTRPVLGVGIRMTADSEEYKWGELPPNGPAEKDEHKIEVTIATVEVTTLKRWWNDFLKELGWY